MYVYSRTTEGVGSSGCGGGSGSERYKADKVKEVPPESPVTKCPINAAQSAMGPMDADGFVDLKRAVKVLPPDSPVTEFPINAAQSAMGPMDADGFVDLKRAGRGGNQQPQVNLAGGLPKADFELGKSQLQPSQYQVVQPHLQNQHGLQPVPQGEIRRFKPDGDRYEDRAHYITIKELGAGSFGTVDLCVDSDSQQQFVRKKLKKASFNPTEVSVPVKVPHENMTHVFGIISNPDNFGSARTPQESLKFVGMTPEYLAPEIAKLVLQLRFKAENFNYGLSEKDVTGKVDVFAFALVIMYIYKGYHILQKLITKGQTSYANILPEQQQLLQTQLLVQLASDNTFITNLIPDECSLDMRDLISDLGWNDM
ncbi:hypothetical protein MAR_006507 [Mya arenaria]|uniref:Protein kinase domain-containing protein n=1 Tax=Mya arenaria TaxID=6604 RepID=A0ABY7D8P0_MYAAR|nr:hypothetical protein MAR_006507 [Mya arenaria]